MTRIDGRYADETPEWLSLSKSHLERLRREQKKPAFTRTVHKGCIAASRKNMKTITLINEAGEIVKYDSLTEAAEAIGYTNTWGSPITQAIKRNGVLNEDGTTSVTLKGKLYRAIIEGEKE